MSNLALGSIVGHEITHSFDELCRHVNKDGKRCTLWSSETINMFDKRSQCVIEQYNNYTVTEWNLQVSHFYKFVEMNSFFVILRSMVNKHLKKILLIMMD
jgi:predicted metalloendopeptidase